MQNFKVNLRKREVGDSFEMAIGKGDLHIWCDGQTHRGTFSF